MSVNVTRIDLVCVGALASDYARIAAEYERRLTRYVKLHVHELKAEPVQRGDVVVLRAEGARMAALLERISTGATRIVALDSRGEQVASEQLVESWLSPGHLVLLIGGTLGLDASAISRAAARVSFGRITLPHQLARVVATEQLYRAFRIARGEPYHF